MTPQHSPDQFSRPGGFEDYLSAAELMPVPPLTDAAWNRLRRQAGRQVAWQFCTLRNLLTHRGMFARDAKGFAWGGIYRTLFVSSIVTTSYRNEGHFRSGERIEGTGDFFYGGFVLPRTELEFGEIIDLVNLRHRVAGVVRPAAGNRVTVVTGYEADYAYVATAFIESTRRGLAACGLPADSRKGRELAWRAAMILYQLAGLTGLTRMPRNLAAHEQFRDAFDRRLLECPPSPRVRRMAQEIARSIIPYTAANAGETVAGHVRRHLDLQTQELLFPGGDIPGELEQQREAWQRQPRPPETLAAVRQRSAERQTIWKRPDIAALHAAYHQAIRAETHDRLIGAIMLHALDASRTVGQPLEQRTITLAADQPLIRQGDRVREMYVVLSATAPLVVLRTAGEPAETRQLATLTPPTVLGEIGLWRGQPAVATVLSRQPNQLEVLVIDHQRFEFLKQEPGFRAATAAEVQNRLALNSALVGSRLEDAAAQTGDPRLASITQLFQYLTGDSHGKLDAVLDLPDAATPAECLDALRTQVDEIMNAGSLPPDLERHLRTVVATIG